MGEDLYELPKGWAWVTVEQISTKVTDGVHKTPNYVNSGIPFISVNNLSDRGTINFKQCKYITIEEHQELFKRCNPEIGDILLSKVGTVGLTAVINTTKDFSLFVNTALIKPVYDLASANFFSFAIRYGFWSSFYNSYISGSTQKFIGTKNISLLPVPLPPLAEQHRIVAKIEELFTQLDAGVELLKKVKAKLKRYRQTVLKAAVEGNLTKEWRTAHQGELEPASVLLERILKQRRQKWEAEQLAKMQAQGKTPKDDSWKLKYKEPVAPDTSELPELPDGWCWATLTMLCSAIGDVDHKMPKAQEKGIPYISTRDFLPDGDINFEDTKKISLEDFEKLCRKIYPVKGDILLSRYGTVGEVRLIKSNLNFQASYSIAIIKPIDYEINKFMAISLETETVQKQIRKYIRGVAQPDLGLAHIKELALPFSSSLEQKEIIGEIERHISVIKQLEKTVDTNIKRAEKLRQSILKQAFTGQLVPQDPNDEPAEKLLERIKAEKAKQVTTKTKKKPTSNSKTKSPTQLALPLE